MRTSALASLTLTILLCFSGCATIIKGRYQELTINSNPPGASFEVDGISGTTPATVPVERKSRYHTVVISKPGYETAQIRVGRGLNLWTAGNVVWGLFGMPIGVGVDLINGSAYKLAMDNVQVDLHSEYPMSEQSISANAQRGGPVVVEAQHVNPPRKDPPNN